jgi:hypothetical protein
VIVCDTLHEDGTVFAARRRRRRQEGEEEEEEEEAAAAEAAAAMKEPRDLSQTVTISHFVKRNARLLQFLSWSGVPKSYHSQTYNIPVMILNFRGGHKGTKHVANHSRNSASKAPAALSLANRRSNRAWVMRRAR